MTTQTKQGGQTEQPTLRDSRFARVTVDFAFKRIFGTERFKDATINLLRSILPDAGIEDVKFLNTEIIGETGESRKAFIDVLCEDAQGRQFVVEMQNARQEHFRERTVFYSSKLISMQPPRGEDWDYSLPATYAIAFLNFSIEGLTGCAQDNGRYYVSYTTVDTQTGARMPGAAEYHFFSLEDFNKTEDELDTYPEKWIYLMKFSESFDEIPELFRTDGSFDTFFEASERAGFTKEEEQKYTSDMMNQWDIANAKNLARKEGLAEGREEGREEGRAEGREEERLATARKMKSRGISFDVICDVTGLAVDQVEKL